MLGEKAEKESRISANSEKIKTIDAALVTKRQDLGSAQNAAGHLKVNFQQLIMSDVKRKHEKLVPFTFLFKGRLKDIEIAGDDYVEKDKAVAEDGAKQSAKNAIVDKLVNRGIYTFEWPRNWFRSSYWARRDAYRIYLETRVSAVQAMQKLNESSSTSMEEAKVLLGAFSRELAAEFEGGVQQRLAQNHETRGKLTEEISDLEERKRELSAESEQLSSRVDALSLLLRGGVQNGQGNTNSSEQKSGESLTK